MALDIAIDANNTGSLSRYWKITSAQLDHLQQSATVWLHGWVDQAARDLGRAPAASITATLARAELPGRNLHAATTAALYQAVKTQAATAAQEAQTGFQRAETLVGASIAQLAGALDI